MCVEEILDHHKKCTIGRIFEDIVSIKEKKIWSIECHKHIFIILRHKGSDQLAQFEETVRLFYFEKYVDEI